MIIPIICNRSSILGIYSYTQTCAPSVFFRNLYELQGLLHNSARDFKVTYQKLMKIRKKSQSVFGRETQVISESKYRVVLNNSEVSAMFVRPMCDLLDVPVDGRNIEQCLSIFTYYSVPLANITPDFPQFGSTIPSGVTAAIGTAFF